MISGKRIIIICFLHCQSWKQHGFFFTCVSMSTTWRPMLDTSWLIKCKMAWKEKINRFTAVMGKHWFLQYHINQTTGKMAKRPLNPGQNSSFSTSQMISPPCYTCFTVLTLWASSFSSWSMGSSSGETEQPEKSLRATVLCCWESTCQMRETFFTHSECCRESRSRRVCWKSENTTWAFAHLPKRRRTTFCSPLFCENFHLRAGLDPSLADLRRRGHRIDVTRTRACLHRQAKAPKIIPEAHLHNHDFNLHVRRQIQFGLESFHHGNQQMNGGQEVFVVDDWQAGSRQ